MTIQGIAPPGERLHSPRDVSKFMFDRKAAVYFPLHTILICFCLWHFIGSASAAAQSPDPPAPFLLPPRDELNRLKSAEIVTNRGTLYFELFPEAAPWHVANLKFLADRGFFDQVPFSIYRPGYIIQSGNPLTKGSGPALYTLPPEFNVHKHRFGALGMARRPDEANYERRSHGSQFHILLGDAPHMDASYTVFGQLINGRKVLQRLGDGDVIEAVRVFVRVPPGKRSD